MDPQNPPQKPIEPGVDYYTDPNGNLVFTWEYHVKRGYCCKNGCRHCPYGNSPDELKPNRKE